MELVVLLSQNSDTWAQVSSLVKSGDWESVILIKDELGKDFNLDKFAETISISSTEKLVDLKSVLLKKLQGKIKGTEVALSIASGTGKEHMALISALLSLPAGIRFVAMTKHGIVYL